MKNAKFLTAVFCLMIFAMAGEAGATIIFDGTFEAADSTPSHLYSKWTGWHCTPQPDSLAIVPAPGGRPGYAAKFTIRPTSAYDCGGNQHDQIGIYLETVPRPNREIWAGHSEMFDTTFYISPAEWMQWGFGGWSSKFKDNCYGSTCVGNTGLTRQYWGGGGTSPDVNPQVLLVNEQFWTSTSNTPRFNVVTPRNVWVDWLYHIKWGHNNDGFVEVYKRVLGETGYTMIWSKYNFNTEFIGYTSTKWGIQTAENNVLEVRAGAYRMSGGSGTQIHYVYNPKVGTKREDVEYGGASASDTTPPSISITCPTPGTYSSQTISVSGTASDNIDVSKVDVKVGAGAWKTATGTTSWSISGIALASGANTVYARATDAAGNAKETSIQVTYNPAATAAPVFVGDFETGDYSQWTGGCLPSNSFQIVTSPVRQGNYAAKFTVTPTTSCWNTERSELYARAPKTPEEHAGDEYYYADSIFFPSTWISSNNWQVLWQVGYPAYGTSPAVALVAGYNNIRLGINAGNSTAIPQWSAYHYEDTILPVTTGEWHDFVFYIKWETGYTGFVKVYHKLQSQSQYTLIKELNNIPTLQNLNGGSSNGLNKDPVPKIYERHIGLYRGAGTGITQTVYHDNFRMGTSFASVTGGTTSGNPAPTCTSSNPAPTCTDGVKNGAETGIDCGGPCAACVSNPTTQLTLKPGWNQISSPVAAGIDIPTIESSCTILPYKTYKLWSWNAQTQTWINPTKVEPLKGYWIYAAYQCTVPLSGTPATFSSLQLYNGWNKISASGTFSAIQGTCATHITGNWVWNWDKATERWVHPATMQLDKGYWIKVDQNCVLGG